LPTCTFYAALCLAASFLVFECLFGSRVPPFSYTFRVAVPYSAGEAIEPKHLSDSGTPLSTTSSLLPVPPVSVLIDHQLVDTSHTTSDGVTKKISYLDQTLFGAMCSVDKVEGLTLFPLDIRIRLDSPAAFPKRTGCALSTFKKASSPPLVKTESTSTPTMNGGKHPPGTSDGHIDVAENSAKRRKVEDEKSKECNGGNTATAHATTSAGGVQDIMFEAERFARVLVETMDP